MSDDALRETLLFSHRSHHINPIDSIGQGRACQVVKIEVGHRRGDDIASPIQNGRVY
jgi:hypothetical protein